ncbi:MerR family transcriptional regulator [Dehalobacter sp. DCM]|uniref:MerR family transcriptional regulator n=1 Tax=Dehalobacter sp. DCM TaxID=2907827 RepID=UPI0030815776|nr:MerR family transcriptional regulator [Dehalobacter sp. DCM]
MKYTIGEFSDMLGVTVDTLRLYEKRGIINPIKDDKNNYRYFDDLDSRVLLASRLYRSLQIPLEDVAELINNGQLEDIIEKIDESRIKLEDQIKKSTLLLNKMIEIKKEAAEIPNMLNRFQEKKLPGIYRIRQTDKDKLLKYQSHKETVSAWMNVLPFCFRSFRINKEFFFANDDNVEYNWGLAIFEDEMPYLDLKITSDIEYIQPQTYLSSILPVIPNGEYFMKNAAEFIISYIKDNHYTVIGDIMGKLMLTQKSYQHTLSYIEAYVPIG